VIHRLPIAEKKSGPTTRMEMINGGK